MFEADSVAVAVQLLLLDAHETGRVVDAAVPRVLCYLRIRVQRLRSGAPRTGSPRGTRCASSPLVDSLSCSSCGFQVVAEFAFRRNHVPDGGSAYALDKPCLPEELEAEVRKRLRQRSP